MEYPKADFSRATLPAPVLERLNSTATVPTVETTTLKTVSVAVTTGGPSPTKETTQPLQTEQQQLRYLTVSYFSQELLEKIYNESAWLLVKKHESAFKYSIAKSALYWPDL